MSTTLLGELIMSDRRGRLAAYKISILVVLLLWLYGSTLILLVKQWWQDPNFSHGFIVPLFSIFILWRNRADFRGLVAQPSWSGLSVLIAAMLMLIVGRLGAELFLARFSLLLLIAGLIVFFLGWNFFRAAAFAWGFLILMIPIPAILFNQITFPLQMLASRVAAAALPLLGVPVLRDGNIIVLPSLALEVDTACSGIRSVMSLFTLAIIYGFFMEKSRPVRWLLALGSIAIAVAANSVRIVGTGLLVEYWHRDWGRGFSHAFWGWTIFLLSLAMLIAFHRLIMTFGRLKGSQA